MINLKQNNIDLGSIKSKVINFFLKEQQKQGIIKSDTEFNQQLNKLMDLVNSSKTIMKLREQSELTNAQDFNQTFEELYIDLLTAFEQMNTVSFTIDQHKKLNSSIISNFKTKLSQINDEVIKLEKQYRSKSSDIVYVENFRSTDNTESDPSLYTDEDGNVVSTAYSAEYDKHNECLKIPKLLTMNKLIATNGQKMATIHINKQLGDGLINIKNPNNSIDKAIDTSIDTYWEETILTDDPIKVELDADKYYKIGFGAVCEIEVVFNNMVKINELSLLPFGQFPLRVEAIRYYQTDQPDEEEGKELVSINKSEPWLNPTLVKDSISFQFPTVLAKRLRILLNQEHYIKSSIIYDKKEQDKNDMWFNKDKDIDLVFDAKYKGLYNDKLLTDKTWLLFNKKIETVGEMDIEKILFPKETKLIPTTKCEYNYGLYNIAVNENDYKDIGIYISKPIKLDTNIAAVSLEVEETIPFEETGEFDIKYFVSPKHNPKNPSDWIPISPGAEVNFRELLDEGSADINISKERFYGTPSATLKLSSSPFVEFGSKINSPMKITIINSHGTVLTESKDIENVTDYYNPMSSYANFTKDSEKIQYYFYKNKIYFNKHLPKEFIIEVDYKHFIDSVRLKAILKRSNNSNNALTPALNSYKLTFKKI